MPHCYYGDPSRLQPSPVAFSLHADVRLRMKYARCYYSGTSKIVQNEVADDLRRTLEERVKHSHSAGHSCRLNTPGEAAFDTIVSHDGDHPFKAHVVYTVEPDYLQGEWVPCFTVHFVNLIPMVLPTRVFHFALAA